MSHSKKAIIIGASSGIGKQLAYLLVKENYHVGITGRRLSLLEQIQKATPTAFTPQQMDVTATDCIPLLEKLVVKLGGLDLLIISAGTGDINSKLDNDLEQKTLATNVTAFTTIATWAFRFFEKQQQGHLVAISSIGGLRGSREAPAYNASKAFQINYLEGLRQKAAKTKLPIYVTDIRPGLVDTAMAKGEGLFWVMPVAKAAQQMLTAIKHKKKVVYVTKRWSIIASILKRLPKFVYDKM